MLQRSCFLLFAFVVTAGAQVPKPQYPPNHWIIENGSFDIRDFRFGTQRRPRRQRCSVPRVK